MKNDPTQERINELEHENAALRQMHQSSLESDSIVASCDCLTKTNEIEYHKPGCKYRLISERDALKAKCEFGELEREAIAHAVVDTIGGTVEGMPTQTINYLQRLRELVRAEADLTACREELCVAKMHADDFTTIDQRDRAEDAANKLTAAILAEDIDWSDHDAKWHDALEQVTSAPEVATLTERNAALEKALKAAKQALSTTTWASGAVMKQVRIALARNREGKPDSDLGTSAGLRGDSP